MQKLHMVSNNRNITHNNLIREHIIWVNRRHRNNGRGVGNVKERRDLGQDVSQP
jgi:hypothetical protein